MPRSPLTLSLPQHSDRICTTSHQGEVSGTRTLPKENIPASGSIHITAHFTSRLPIHFTPYHKVTRYTASYVVASHHSALHFTAPYSLHDISQSDTVHCIIRSCFTSQRTSLHGSLLTSLHITKRHGTLHHT